MSQAAHIDIEKLEALIEHKDFATAKKIIDSAIDQDISKEERGKAYVHLAKIYLHLTNKINEEYVSELDKTIKLAKDVTSSQKESNKTIKTAELRQQLADDSN
jgi:hypothetical protein